MDFWRSAAGILCVEVISADNSAVLQALTNQGVSLYDISEINGLTLTVMIDRTSHERAERIVERHGGSFRVVRTQGLYWRFKSVCRRPTFLLGILLILLCAVILPSRIFFVKVEGNSIVPDKLIIEKAEEFGICFGASRKSVRSEKVKNALLSAIPELQWTGVNTSGCVATIHVQEKEIETKQETGERSVSSIVAARDGVIVSTTIWNGEPQCVVGQAVKAGETLVSGYTDCGIIIRAGCADAEILARTIRSQQVITPILGVKREAQFDCTTRYSIRIGKKLIKFYKDSGISDTTCVKMYVEDYLTLPGDFCLPVSLIRETLYDYDTTSYVLHETNWLQDASKDYLLSQMVAGQILDESIVIDSTDNAGILYGTYACLEMIGQVKHEEILFAYGEEH